MADRGMSRADLGELIGAPSGRVSEILNRRRPLTIDMIRKLAEGLGLSEHCLLQEYELDRLHAGHERHATRQPNASAPQHAGTAKASRLNFRAASVISDRFVIRLQLASVA